MNKQFTNGTNVMDQLNMMIVETPSTTFINLKVEETDRKSLLI